MVQVNATVSMLDANADASEALYGLATWASATAAGEVGPHALGPPLFA
jgi:hypothetical protein